MMVVGRLIRIASVVIPFDRSLGRQSLWRFELRRSELSLATCLSWEATSAHKVFLPFLATEHYQ